MANEIALGEAARRESKSVRHHGPFVYQDGKRAVQRMRTLEEIEKRLSIYDAPSLFYRDWGYIAWHLGTGQNVEILFIEVREPRKGYGTRLIQAMKKEIHPYHSVYVFRRAVNTKAGAFYRKLGFTETTISNIYKGEDAVLGVIPYENL